MQGYSERERGLISKYLARWAEPEAALLAGQLREPYDAALVVPALGESASLIDGFRAALSAPPGRRLLVLVVNSSACTERSLQAKNQALLAEVRRDGERLSASGALLRGSGFDLLLIDRASRGRELPAKQGVGLARKIGADLVLALSAFDRLRLPWIFFSDADASLPPAYFGAAEAALDGKPSALLYPFRHVQGEQPDAHSATELYEISLRYQVLGLAWARSPYAYHSIGSTIAVDAAAYAAVRGVPKRAAGEDFYLLDKLAKVGIIRRLDGEPVRIRSRYSSRVPFGTGPRVQRILERGDVSVSNPQAFLALRRLIAAIEQFARTPRRSVFDTAFDELPLSLAQSAGEALLASGLLPAAEAAAREVGAGDLGRRLHTWFDALRTLRWLHSVRDRGQADLSWREALATAEFTDGPAPLEARSALEFLIELERQLPFDSGPTVR